MLNFHGDDFVLFSYLGKKKFYYVVISVLFQNVKPVGTGAMLSFVCHIPAAPPVFQQTILKEQLHFPEMQC